MKRFFFDLVAVDQKYFDYHGRYFLNAESAQQHAQIICLDAGATDEWQGGQVEVRDEAGLRLFSLPIVESVELRAAA